MPVQSNLPQVKRWPVGLHKMGVQSYTQKMWSYGVERLLQWNLKGHRLPNLSISWNGQIQEASWYKIKRFCLVTTWNDSQHDEGHLQRPHYFHSKFAPKNIIGDFHSNSFFFFLMNGYCDACFSIYSIAGVLLINPDLEYISLLSSVSFNVLRTSLLSDKQFKWRWTKGHFSTCR